VLLGVVLVLNVILRLLVVLRLVLLLLVVVLNFVVIFPPVCNATYIGHEIERTKAYRLTR
jgi:hypothetical protein